MKNDECVGIVYSHATGTHCYVCKDDRLSPAINKYGFYRIPGKFSTIDKGLLKTTVI